MEQDPEKQYRPPDEPHDKVLGGLRRVIDSVLGHPHREAARYQLGIPRIGRDAMQQAVYEEIETRSHDIRSKDPDTRAAALRYFNMLRWAELEEPGDPDELFQEQILSGNEAKGCLLEILTALPLRLNNLARETLGFPKLPKEVRKPNAFTEHPTELQETALVQIIGRGIINADYAIGEEKLIRVSQLIMTDEYIAVMAGHLQTRDRFKEVTQPEILEAFDWARGLMPRFLREAFERQEALKEQHRRETNTL